MTDARSAALSFLRAHAADRTDHINGDLLTHLEGTRALLVEWGSDEDLCLAGLCHAAYGTDGFPPSLIDTSERNRLRDAIGERAEAEVFFYAACDRSFLYRQFDPKGGRGRPIRYRDRFSSAVSTPDAQTIHRFVELTYANELELARAGDGFREKHRAFFLDLFERCRPWASPAAHACFRETYALQEDERESPGA